MGKVISLSLSLLVLSATSAQANEHRCQHFFAPIYLTDAPEQFAHTLAVRQPLYDAELKTRWSSAPANFIRHPTGEEILQIEGFEIMREFEKPYMEELARIATQHGGRILNVGYGLGLIDEAIEKQRTKRPLQHHHIVELNAQVTARAQQWRSQQTSADSIFIHSMSWEQALEEFAQQHIQFDSVIYDAFPLDEKDIHRDFVPFLEKLLRLKLVKERTGIVTFYMDSQDGLGSRFIKYAQQLGVQKFAQKRVQVELPNGGTQYWQKNYFWAPMLSGIIY